MNLSSEKNYPNPENQAVLFARFFDLANKLQILMDRELQADGLTSKQWLLTLAIERYGSPGLTLTEAAARLGCSHQNAKQLALKLNSKGFLTLSRDSGDRRQLRLEVTDSCREYWERRGDRDTALLSDLFSPLTGDETDHLLRGVSALLARTKEMLDPAEKGDFRE